MKQADFTWIIINAIQPRPMLTTTTARKEAKLMDENKNLEKNDEVKVAGGATINGAQKTLIEESEIKKYEYAYINENDEIEVE